MVYNIIVAFFYEVVTCKSQSWAKSAKYHDWSGKPFGIDYHYYFFKDFLDLLAYANGNTEGSRLMQLLGPGKSCIIQKSH